MISDLSFELKYKNYLVAGVDEAGRGPLAGPVIAGAVIIDQKNLIPGIKDSKLLSKKRREILYQEIIRRYCWAIGIVWNDEIDEINILQATKKACVIAVQNLEMRPSIVLIDGDMKFHDQKNYISIINGDNLSHSIAAGSIVAKVTRDCLMAEIDKEFPLYSWRKNLGYGTKEHIKAIRSHGLSMYHRKSFRIKN
ncbi:MAG: ribonuclease HII [Janthinobacterium lividum]